MAIMWISVMHSAVHGPNMAADFLKYPFWLDYFIIDVDI
jgi:hypothetical protein